MIFIRGSRCNEGGFTFVEVMLAVVILSIALISLLDLFHTSLISYRSAGEDTESLNLGQAVLEQLLAKDYTDPDLNTGVTGPKAYPGFSDYTYEIEITVYDPVKNVKKLVVRIYPNDQLTQKTELTTLLAKK